MEIQESVLLRRVGRMDPVSVPEFEALGGFSGIRKALSMEKEEILEEISRSNLKGRRRLSCRTEMEKLIQDRRGYKVYCMQCGRRRARHL